MGQQKYCSSCGVLCRHSETPKPKGKYQKHFFKYRSLWYYPHLFCNYVETINASYQCDG